MDLGPRDGADVVLIVYHFPPDPAVGSLRAAKVARAFRAAGRRVHVVTARLAGESGPRVTDDPGLSIHLVDCIPDPGELFLRLKARLFPRWAPSHAASGAAAGSWTAPATIPGWKRLVFALLSVPDDRQGFVPPAWWQARRLVRQGARLVYSTGPPFSAHLVALALKASMEVRWAMELRDPWVDNPQKPWRARTRATDALDARLERRCLTRADRVVVVSEGIRRQVASRLPSPAAGRLVLVRNGIDELADAVPARRGPGPVRITYAGTFYHGRDPRPFLKALAVACRRLGLGPDDVRVDLVGSCRFFGSVSVEQEIGALGLTGVVRMHDWLPPAAAKTFVDEADVLLLLARQQPDQVPNKLYDYLGTRRHILAFVDAEGETAGMLRRVGGHYLVVGDGEAEAEAAVREVLTAVRRGEVVAADDRVLKEWTTDEQMRQLLAAVEG